jgi:2-iminobutanoate/2-iminopropanoate deaminase
MTDIVPVFPSDVPPPGGHYSPGIIFGDLVFVSGQLPVSESGDHALAKADFEMQARQVFRNLIAVLRAAGAGLEDVLKVTLYVSSVDHWGQCNTIYAEIFGDHRPARAVVPTGPLHHGYLIEVEAIARKPA